MGNINQSNKSIGVRIALGAAFGIILGIVFGNIGLGIALGAGIGILIGAAFNSIKNKKNNFN